MRHNIFPTIRPDRGTQSEKKNSQQPPPELKLRKKLNSHNRTIDVQVLSKGGISSAANSADIHVVSQKIIELEQEITRIKKKINRLKHQQISLTQQLRQCFSRKKVFKAQRQAAETELQNVPGHLRKHHTLNDQIDEAKRNIQIQTSIELNLEAQLKACSKDISQALIFCANRNQLIKQAEKIRQKLHRQALHLPPLEEE